MLCLGTVPASTTIYIPFATYDGSDGSSVTCTGLAVTDIEIYKNGSSTQRASDAGYTLLDTDGIDFDGITGLHGFSIDLSDNTDAGFYAVGSWYWVVVSSITVDSQTVNFIAAVFRIGPAESVTGYSKADVSHWLGTAAATPTIAGVPEVDLTYIAGSAVSTSTAQLGVNTVSITNNAITANAINNDAITAAKIADAAIDAATFAAGAINAAAIADGAIDAATFAAGAIDAAAIATNAIDADALAADAVTEIKTGLAVAPAKNAEFANFTFLMVLSSDHLTPATGKTVVVQISKDGAAFGNADNTPATEIANGFYKITFTAAEMNADIIAVKCTEADCDQRSIIMVTSG